MPASDFSSVLPVVLAAYLSPWMQGRHVALLGSTANGWVEELRKAGARSVHPHRLDERALVRDRAFGVSVVPNASFLPSFSEVLAEAARITSKDGVVAVVVTNPPAVSQAAPLGYYELYDALSAQFPYVKMVGNYPFQGFTLVDFTTDQEPEATLDTSLISELQRDPLLYIGIGSHSPLELDNYSVIEVPEAAEVAPLMLAPEPENNAKRAASELAAKDAETQRLQRELAAKDAETQRLQGELAAKDAEAQWLQRELEAKSNEALRVQPQLAAKTSELQNVQRELAAKTTQLQGLQRELDTVRAERSQQQTAEKKHTHEREHERLRTANLEAELHALHAAHEQGQSEQVERETLALREAYGNEVQALEATLRERAHEIAKLRREIIQRGEMVHELLHGAVVPVDDVSISG